MSNFCKFLFFLCILFFFNSFNLFSQQDYHRRYSLKQVADFGFGSSYSGNKNFIEISYGIGDLIHKNLNTTFHKLSLNEIKLGRRFMKPLAKYRLIKFSDNYLFSSFVDDFQRGEDNTSKVSYEMWRFGLGYRKGYGYNFGTFAIFPFYQTGLVWSKVNLSLPDSSNSFIPQNEFKILDLYEDQIKFGSTNIGGINFKISSFLGVGASYETSVIFPYHKFWKQLGSSLIEILSQTGLDFLTEGVIVKAVPQVTPILYFIIKNGLSYYLFTQKKDEMNWPFDTVEPLTIESFKFSVKISL